MRIGFITGEYPPMRGGVGAYSHLLARHVRDLGHAVFIYGNQRAAPLDEIPLEAAVSRWDIGSVRRAKTWARAHRLDIISLQYQTAAYAMSPYIHFAPELLRPYPVVTTFHDLRYPYLFPKAGRVRAWIVRRLARASAGVIVTNHEDQIALEALRPLLAHCTMIPIGSNIDGKVLDDFDPLAWRVGVAVDSCLVAYFGLINRSKGIEILLHSLKMLRAEGLSIHLIMIGAGAGSSDESNIDYTKDIETLIDQLELRPHITQTGYLDDAAVAAHLRAADIVALPFTDGASFRRGTLMAAIQHGAAILTTTPRVPIPEFTSEHVMIFAPPGDVHGFTEALRGLYGDVQLRADLRRFAAQLAPQFAWQRIARETVTAFARVLEQPR